MIPDLDKKILAYCLSEKRIAFQLQTLITIDYLHPDVQSFYKLFLLCLDKFREIPTPKILEEQGASIWNNEMSRLYAEILDVSYDAKEFLSDLEKLKKRYNTQLLLKFGKEVFNSNWNGENFSNLNLANQALKKLSGSVDSIYNNKVFKEGTLSDTAKDAWEEYKKVRDNPDIYKGILVGFKEFDRITNGLQPAELMLVGGESGAGKSTLSMQMGINAWLGQNKIPTTNEEFENLQISDSGVNVLYFSIEMPYKPLRRRVDSNLAGIPLYGLRDGTLTAEEIERFKISLKFQMRYNKYFHIIDVPRGCTMAQIESKFIEKSFESVPNLVIIDYISLMTADSEEGSDWLNLGRLAEQMHEFARTYNVAVISPVQLNRPPKQNGGEAPSPDQHRVGRSNMLVQNANILLNIRTRKDERLRSDMEVHVVKNRDGENSVFVLQKRLDMMRLYDDAIGWTPQEYNKDGYDIKVE